MADTETKTRSTGRHLLEDGDFVALEDGAGNEVGAVPKHWGAELIPAGLTKTRRKPTKTRTTEASSAKIDEAVAKVRAEYEAKIAELTAAGGSTPPPAPPAP